jgi:hypothetical protein
MTDPDLKQRMQQILDSVLAVSRGAAGGQRADYSAIDDLLDDFIAQAAPRMAEGELTEFLKMQQSLRRSSL